VSLQINCGGRVRKTPRKSPPERMNKDWVYANLEKSKLLSYFQNPSTKKNGGYRSGGRKLRERFNLG